MRVIMSFSLLVLSNMIAGIFNYACANDLSGLYIGKIANQDIVLLIGVSTTNKHNLAGKYFYKKNGIDLNLTVSKTKSGFSAEESFKNKMTGSWDLKRISSPYGVAIFNGQWVSPKNTKRYKTVLYKVDTSAVVDTEVADLYENYKININLQSGNTQYAKKLKKSGIEYIWRHSNIRTGQNKIRSPYLIKHPNKKILMLVNNILEAHHRSAVMQALACDQTLRNVKSRNEFGEYNLETKVALLTRKLLSVKANASWICSGTAIAHNSSRSFSIDLSKGRIFKFKDYFNKKSGYGSAHGEKKDQIKNLARQYFKKMPKKGEEYDCLRFYTQLFGYSLSVAQDGLVFNLDLPRAAQVCVEDVLIPYSALRPYVKNKFKAINQY